MWALTHTWEIWLLAWDVKEQMRDLAVFASAKGTASDFVKLL